LQYINITDINDKRLSVYKDLNESQLRHYYEPDGGVFIAESLKVIERAFLFGCKAESVLLEKEKLDSDEYKRDIELVASDSSNKADNSEDKEVKDNKEDKVDKEGDIPIYVAEQMELSKITGYNLTGGILAVMRRPDLKSVIDIIDGCTRIAILDTVVNPTNIGAIFRSAAAFNVEAILLTKGCCDPLSRRAIRVSMGNVFQIPWTYLDSNEDEYNDERERQAGLVKENFDLLHEKGFKTAAMALKEDSIRLDDERLKKEEKLAIIMGNEGDGLSDAAIAMSDYKVIIPMAHEVDSLNVAAASAVAFWELAR
jgi:tRNA G18 (ribose-2'-O)-methylase SpoU